MIEFEIKKKIVLTDEIMDDILSTALEGGIGYWACLLNGEPEYEQTLQELLEEKKAGKIPEVFYSTVIRRMMELGRPVKFQDAEDEDGKIWELTKENFIEGVQIYESERGDLLKELDRGNFDAIEADCLIQYALFKEVVFG